MKRKWQIAFLLVFLADLTGQATAEAQQEPESTSSSPSPAAEVPQDSKSGQGGSAESGGTTGEIQVPKAAEDTKTAQDGKTAEASTTIENEKERQAQSQETTVEVQLPKGVSIGIAAIILLNLGITLLNTFILLRLRKLTVPALPQKESLSADADPKVSRMPDAGGRTKSRTTTLPEPVSRPTEVPTVGVKEPQRQLEPNLPPAPSAAAPVAEDVFALLAHGKIGRALEELRVALPRLAEEFLDERLRERFLAQLHSPLSARVERFKKATQEGEAALREHWIEPDLVTTLNSLAQFLSLAISERRQGRGGGSRLVEDLQSWLYDRLAPLCQQEGFFSVELILPYTTTFDPEIHNGVGRVQLEGATRPLVVEIKAIGRRHPQRNFVTHKADVIVGR